MIVSVFRRRLKPGATFEDFQQAWMAEAGFGVPARVFNAVSLTDERDILTFGFVDIDPAQLEAGMQAVASQEAVRHDRIDDVIESTELRGFYELRTEHDLTADPRPVDIGAPPSLLAGFAAEGTDAS